METKFSSGGGGPRRDLSRSRVGSRLPGAAQQCHRGRADGPPGEPGEPASSGGPRHAAVPETATLGALQAWPRLVPAHGVGASQADAAGGEGAFRSQGSGGPRIPRGEGRWARLPRPSPAVLSPSGPEPLGSVHSRACGQHARSLLGDPRGEGTEIGGEEGPQSPWSLLTESSPRAPGRLQGGLGGPGCQAAGRARSPEPVGGGPRGVAPREGGRLAWCLEAPPAGAGFGVLCGGPVGSWAQRAVCCH